MNTSKHLAKLMALAGALALGSAVFAQQETPAAGLAQTAMRIWPDSFAMGAQSQARWSYDQGVILKGVEGLWKQTGDVRWFNYLQHSMDFFVQEDGTIKGYRPDEYNIDHINNGKAVLLLYRVTGKEKYRKAAMLLRNQLRTHPRTAEGGFWHKNIYPNQMWLDGLYMGQPFYAEYAKVFGEDTIFNDVTRQFALMERRSRDPKTGLLYHGYDESRQQKWADPATGRSPHVWGRALGWYGMALVDALEQYPAGNPGVDTLTGILNRFAASITSLQDKASGVWYDIPALPKEKGNYLEASASSMLIYTLAKGVRLGYLPAKYLANAKTGYAGLLQQFYKVEGGNANLHGTVSVSGLGGKPYRDGSFAYYMSEKVIVNDPKGMGAFIQAANEMDLVKNGLVGMGKTVLLDRFFNNEYRAEFGEQKRFHYTWEDMTHSGFATMGSLFRDRGAKTLSLDAAPTAANLKGANVYIIVDADTEKESAKPNFMTEESARNIAEWVKGGGVLLLFANDKGNAELAKFNTLASKFGIRFNEDNHNMVKNDQFEQGAVAIEATNPVFKGVQKVYVKELASLALSAPAQAIVKKDGLNVMATAKYGKGMVFAIGDPWLYNEYVDGRKLPADFQNHEAARALVQWALTQGKK
ncbi:glycoside hydrolase family 88 protein [Cnuella takakiae]|uniref:glycoside hydrolase family 88 protein n=1 Tax=Cnuella takakiae TaxID=1302690 RepID=UPI001FE7D42A|nr:glycoside hydrolase family 88 protein [Cnuella takakiae]